MGYQHITESNHPLELAVRATTPKGCQAPPEVMARAREALIEAVAAQIYTLEHMTKRDSNPKYWRDLDSHNRDHFRKIAQRKLKTGEIHGWPK